MKRLFDRLWNEGDRIENIVMVFYILLFVAFLAIMSYQIISGSFGSPNGKGMEGDLTPQIILSNPMNMP